MHALILTRFLNDLEKKTCQECHCNLPEKSTQEDVDTNLSCHLWLRLSEHMNKYHMLMIILSLSWKMLQITNESRKITK